MKNPLFEMKQPKESNVDTKHVDTDSDKIVDSVKDIELIDDNKSKKYSFPSTFETIELKSNYSDNKKKK